MLGWLVFDNRNIYWSGACSYLVSISLSWRWPRKKTIWLLWSSVVQHKNIGRGPCSCKASLVIRTDTSKSCYSYCPGLVASSVWKVPQDSSVLGSLQALFERSLSIARLGKQIYFISVQTFACRFNSFWFQKTT